MLVLTVTVKQLQFFFWWLLSLWFKCVGRTILFSVLDFSQNSFANCVCNISHLELPLNLKLDHEL